MTLVVGFVLIFIVSRYHNLLDKYTKLKENRADDIQGATKTASEIIQKAQKQSESIVSQSTQSGQQYLQNIQKLISSSDSVISKEVGNTSKVYLAEYQKALVKIQQDLIKSFSNIPSEVKVSLDNEFEKLDKSFDVSISKSQENINLAFQKILDSFDKEMKDYKQARMDRIEKDISKIAIEIAKKVIKKEISEKDHEGYVLSALDEAKKEGLW